MAQQIYVNLPVKDLKRSVEFFTRLGYRFDPRFTDDNATCMIVSDTIFVMLLAEPFFKTFTPKAVADATRTTEVLVALSADSREAVDDLVLAAISAGGRALAAAKDHGFMYQHGFEDLDGHLWELVHMDPSQLPPEMPA